MGGSTIPSQEYTDCSNGAAAELLKASMGLTDAEGRWDGYINKSSCLTLTKMDVIDLRMIPIPPRNEYSPFQLRLCGRGDREIEEAGRFIRNPNV